MAVSRVTDDLAANIRDGSFSTETRCVATGSPEAVRVAAVKPAPVSALKRRSAFKRAFASYASKLCRVSPLWSMMIWVAIARISLMNSTVACRAGLRTRHHRL